MSLSKWGRVCRKRSKKERFFFKKKNGDYIETHRISVIKPWATVTSGNRMILVLVSYYLCGRKRHPASFIIQPPSHTLLCLLMLLYRLAGLLFWGFAPSLLHVISRIEKLHLDKICDNLTLQFPGFCSP